MSGADRPARILLVDDSRMDVELTLDALRRDGLDVEPLVVADEAGLRAALASFAPDVILADLAMPGFSGAAAIAIAGALDPSVPSILVSGAIGEELLPQAIRTGAIDYVPKRHLDALAPAVRRALDEGAERRARVQLEAELRVSKSRLAALMEHVPDHVYFKDANSRFTMISRAMARSFGLDDPAEAIGRTDFDFFTEQEATKSLEDEREIMRTGRPLVDLAETETWPDGRETWASTTKLPGTDEHGTVVGTFGISRDITGRIATEAALRESQAGMRSSLDAMRDPFLVATAVRDADGSMTGFRSIFANRAAAAFMGLAPDTMSGAPPPGQVPFLGKETFFEVFRRVVETGEGWTEDGTEFSVPGADGTRRRGLIDIQVARSGDGFFATWQDVTDKERLRRESERLAAALEQTADGVAVVEQDGTVVYVNPAFLASHGLTREGLVGRDVRPFAAAVLETGGLTELMAAIQTGESWRREVVHALPDGSQRHSEITVTPTREHAGAVTGYVVLSHDVTAQREAEATLERRRALRRAVAAVGRRLLQLKDASAVANEACRAVVGTGEVAMAWVGLLDPATGGLVAAGSHGDTGYLQEVAIRADDSPLGRGPAGEAIRTGAAVVCNDIATDPSMAPWREAAERYGYRSGAAFPVRHGDATRGVLVVYGAPPGAFEADAAGVLGQLAADIALALTAIDETERRQEFDAALAASERRLRELLSDVPLFATMLDARGNLLFANRYLGELTGDPDTDLVGQNWFERFVPEEDREAQRAAYLGALERGTISPRWHNQLIGGTGGTHEVEWSSAYLRDDAGTIVGLASLGADVTERAAAEAEIRRLNEGLEQRVLERTASLEAANRELETFSYTVSHDLRSPLRAITGFAEILDRRYRGRLDPKGRHYLDNIVEGGRHMGVLIEELLEYSRLGRGQVHAEPVALGPILERLRSVLAGRIAASGGMLAVAEPLAVPLGDPVLLEQALANLLDNAFTYRRPGVAPLVAVSAARRGARVVLAVADNGMGIAPEFQARVFEPFVRLHADDAYPGTGIGLATVRKAARLMGSEVRLASAEGAGSTFSLELPAAPAGGGRP